MANINKINGNPIVLDASGISENSITPSKLAGGYEFAGEIFEDRSVGLIPASMWDDFALLSDASLWMANKKYSKGYINGVTVRVSSTEDETCTVVVLKDNGDGTATKVITESATGNGDLFVPINYLMTDDFYVAIKCKNSAYANLQRTPVASIDTQWFARSISQSAATVNVPQDGFLYYHEYAVSMLTVNDILTELYNSSVVGTGVGAIVSWSDGPYETVLDIPKNHIVSFYNNGTLDNCIPTEAVGRYHTIVKLSHRGSEDTNTGFTLYIAAVLANGNVTTLHYAYAISNQSVDTLIWHKLNYNPASKGIDRLGIESLSIVFIGDSIVEGYGSSDYNGGADGTSGHQIENNVKTWYRNTGAKCWANQMIAYLTETYNDVTACNNGIGGFTPEQILNNIDTLTIDDDGNRADVVVLSIGTNSRNASNKVSAIVNPVKNTVKWLQEHNIQPIVLTNSPLINQSRGNNAATIQSCIIRACNLAGVPCYDLLSRINFYMWEHDIPLEASADQTKFMHDNLHPADIGYEVMFELIKQILRV